MTSTPALEIIQVSKTFPGQRALKDLSLEVAAGEVHALLGENGSGKSTLIKVLAGIHPPDQGGSVRVRSESLRFGSPQDSHARGLRFVHQRLGLVAEFNALENLGLGAGFHGRGRIDWRRQEQAAAATFERLGGAFDLRRPMRDCTAVERTVVAIARAICPDPHGGVVTAEASVLVLDEPTSSLPADEVDRLLAVVRDLSSAGVAVIYVSHRLDEVERIADRVSVLRDGVLVGTRSRSELDAESMVELIVGRKVSRERVRETSPASPDPAVTIRGLSTSLVGGLDLVVGEGEIIGIAGVAGSGREHVAKALVGAMPLDAGTMATGSLPERRISGRVAQRCGVVLALGNTQPASAVRDFSVTENLTLPTLDESASFGRLDKAAERKRAGAWASELDVRPLDGRRVFQLLSGGNQQKVILARSLMRRPRVLVLDEPTLGVDVGSRRRIYESIEQYTHDGMGVVIASSDVDDLISLCDRVIVLRDGRPVAELAGDHLNEHALLAAASGDLGAAPAVTDSIPLPTPTRAS